jgi:hypothetical protein
MPGTDRFAEIPCMERERVSIDHVSLSAVWGCVLELPAMPSGALL